jgi:hypothetical protein
MTRSEWPSDENETARLTIPSSSGENNSENPHSSGISIAPARDGRNRLLDWFRNFQDTLEDSQCCFHCCACSLDLLCNVFIRIFAYLVVAGILVSAFLPNSTITPKIPLMLGFSFVALLLIGNVIRIIVERHLQTNASLTPVNNLNTLEGFWARRRRIRNESRNASTLRSLQFAARIQELREEGLSERQLEEIVHMTQTGRNAPVAEIRLILGRPLNVADITPPPARIQDINRLPSYAFSSTGKKTQQFFSDIDAVTVHMNADDDDDDDDIKTAIRLSLQDQTSRATIDVTAAQAISTTALTSASALSINSLERRDKDFCTICLDNFKEGSTIRILPCFHSFCSECIDPWLQQRSICPVCKNSIFHTS